MYELSSPGWFSNVNGVGVVHHALPADLMEHAGEFYGHHGIEWHRQDGPNEDIFGTRVARGYPIATWSVDDEGVVHQYNDLRVADWHGDSVSHYAFGVEHQGVTGTPCTTRQLDASAALCAAIIEVTEDLWGEEIPLVKVPRISLSNYKTAQGFWDHNDVDDGPLNENGHVDRLEGRSWADQLTKIGDFLQNQPPPIPTFHGTFLRLGVVAADVIRWKRRMAVKGLFARTDENDGPYYGPAIGRATRTFQQRSGLTVDGVVGPDTWGAAWG
ncbi:MAG TPA: peptidoglycan-binding domain-containing protein [Actinomycetota bacterium]|jgi:peptidoglycan hydrolase-like protein with peptidoglycan-binding domain